MSKILIVQATFYKDISALLLEGATKKIIESGYKYEFVTVPGALEIASAINFAKDKKGIFGSLKYSGYVALGCVIRGETSHYDYVCQESASALTRLALDHKLPIANGIITVENEAQALERASIDKKNKGGFAAAACIKMIEVKKFFERKN
jgi:6,7-dimethyl-8-ribityllumazine synthase